MSPELDRKLVAKYPELYRDRYKSMKQTAMCWGFDCGDGWFGIIDQLSADITNYCIAHNCDIPIATQVKEKFGGLRFYLGSIHKDCFDNIYNMIDEAEKLSYKTCETCGKAGILRGGSWLQTLCDEHAEGQEPYETPTT